MDQTREAYYAFPHIVLRQFALDRPGECLAILSDPEEAGKLLTDMAEFVNNEAAKSAADKSTFERIDPEQITLHRMADDQPACLIIELPPPKAATECYFVGLIFNVTDGARFADITEADLRYMTLELGISVDGEESRTVLCGWTKTAHNNYGDGPPPTVEEFARAIMSKS